MRVKIIMGMSLLLMLACGLVAGCSSTLSTGYRPRALGVTPDERRAYYAPPFSPEAQQGAAAGERAGRARPR